MDQHVAVLGLGYIGLPTAAMMALSGYQVTGVDLSADRVDSINEGRVPFVEPALGGIVEKMVAGGRLRAQTQCPTADVFIIAVPTPFMGDGHRVDTSYIDAATDAIIPHLRGNELVILESTSPPGTTERLVSRITDARPALTNLAFAHAPERVLPGRIMEEIVTNDRIIGGVTPSAAERTRQLYASFCKGQLHLTDARTAEMTKLTENAFRDVNIAFANELSLVCDELDIDVWELIRLANKHPRVNILQPGPGVGGHCIAVDPWFIVSTSPTSARLIRMAREVNDSKPSWVLNKVRQAAEQVDRPVIAVLGLAFKPDIDDLRESPALAIAEALPGLLPEATVLAVEPHVQTLPGALASRGVKLADLASAIPRADIVLLLVDHAQFRDIDARAWSDKIVIDTRGVLRGTRGPL